MSVGPQPSGAGPPGPGHRGLDRVYSRVGGRGLVRPRRGRLLAGVAAGLGRRFGVSPWVVRAVFVVSVLVPGPQFLAYLALWIVMPAER